MTWNAGTKCYSIQEFVQIHMHAVARSPKSVVSREQHQLLQLLRDILLEVQHLLTLKGDLLPRLLFQLLGLAHDLLVPNRNHHQPKWGTPKSSESNSLNIQTLFPRLERAVALFDLGFNLSQVALKLSSLCIGSCCLASNSLRAEH